MKINAKPYDENQTLHVTEATVYDVKARRKWLDEYHLIVQDFYKRIHEKNFKTSLKVFKTVVGKQFTVKTYSHRNWIWTFTSEDDLATVYCLVSVRGVAWEFDKTSRKSHVLPLLKEIVELF